MGTEPGPGFNPEMCQDKPSAKTELAEAEAQLQILVGQLADLYVKAQGALWMVRRAIKAVWKN